MRAQYEAGEYEVLDLLDYVRTPADLINRLVDDRAVTTPLTRLVLGTSDGPVDVARPSRSNPTIRIGRDRRRVATVPADRHLDVLAMLDSGLELDHRLQSGQLVTVRRSRQPWPSSQLGVSRHPLAGKRPGHLLPRCSR
ncbi:hypothetical protein ACIPY6_43255 [Streptomyces sp. NPDC090054]|uniref:hypothetical protein n=1 Tax=Streptomyces sp. NPDC090054 TaxID=3365933 RepID=UPI0037F24A1A